MILYYQEGNGDQLKAKNQNQMDGQKFLYYRKHGPNPGATKPKISLLEYVNGKLRPTHKYITVDSWQAAKALLKTTHNATKVQESSDMFKVFLPLE
jgi:hypothetical protein